MSAPGSGYKMESQEARALASITTDSYDYRDQAKLLTKLTGDVSYLAQYTRQMQKGIDDANRNFIQQIQDFINEIFVVIAGGGETGFDFGDLKYILQAIGALFGFDTESGIASIFPINLFSAAWHFLSTYILPVENFTEFVNWMIDQLFATILDIFGDIPIVGQALQQFIVWLTQIRDIVGFLGTIFGGWTESIATFVINTVNFLWETFLDWTEPIATFVLNTINFLWNLFGSWTAPLVQFIVDTANWIWETFFSWTEPIATFVLNAIGFLWDLFGSWTTALVNWITESLDWLVNVFAEWTEPIATWVTTTIDFLVSLFSEWTAPFVSLVNQVVAVVQDIVDWFVGGIGNALSNLFPWAKKLPQMEVVGGLEVVKTENVPGLDAAKITGGTLNVTRVPSLPSEKINDNAITSDKIANFAVGSGKIANNAVDTNQIANLAVTGLKTQGLDGTKITEGSVAAERIANLAAGKITSGTFGTAFIADDAITNAKIGPLAVSTTEIANDAINNDKIAPSAVGTTEIANLAVTGLKTQSLDATKITDGTINASRLPGNVISTVGSGITMSRNNSTGGGTYQAVWSGNGEILPSNFYNVIGSNTSDLTKVTVNTNKLGVRATYAGWYLVEVGYQLDINTNFGFSWALTPAIAINSASITKWGASALSARDTGFVDRSDTCPWAQSSFIAYLGANEYVSPAYVAIREGTNSGTAGIITPVGGGLGTYFSVALLNRSLS